jgi:hypothetical protein
MTLRCLLLAALALAAAPGTAGAATQPVRVGPVTVTVPGGWRLAGPRAASRLTFAIGRGEHAALTLARPAARSLLPARGPRRAAWLAGHPAWRYGRVTLLPTTAGVLALACDRCAEGVTGVSGAIALAPSPDLAFRLRLPGVLARLDGERVSARAALRRARTRRAQASAARALAAAYRRATGVLEPLAGPAQRPVVAALTGLAGAYDRLARADSPARYAAARGAVAAAERGAAPLLSRGYRLRVATRPPPAPGRDGPSAPLLGLALVAIVAGGLALRRRPRTPPPPPPLPPPELMPLRWDAPI